MTNKPLKGYIPKEKKELQMTPRETADSINTVVGLVVGDLKNLKNEIISEFDSKKAEVDDKIAEVSGVVDAKVQEVDETIQEAKTTIEQTKQEAIQVIRDIKQGEPGKDADETTIVDKVLAQVPKFDEEKLKTEILSLVPTLDRQSLIKEVISKIPENKASLKIIQEKFETDPMSVIEKILALPEDKLSKLKLKVTNIDGLEQTISAFRNQISNRGYMHGGGDTVVAGAGITITTNSNGTKTIASTADLSVTLNDVSVNSITTPNSLYQMTPGIPVEFKTSGGTHLLYLDETNAFVGIGTNSPVSEFELVSMSTATSRGITETQISSDALGARYNLRKARGALGSITTIVSGDVLGRVSAWGYDGSNYLLMGQISINSTGTIAATRVPTTMTFSTATDATPSVLTTALTLDSSQNATFAGQILASDGTTALPGIAYSGATGTGFYRATTSVGLSIAGTTALVFTRVGTNGSISGASGNTVVLNSTANGGHIVLTPVSSGQVQISGNTLLGGLTTNGTGILQLPAATTSAGGITFGTDINVYRSATNTFTIASTTTDTQLIILNSASGNGVVIERDSSRRGYLMNQDNANLILGTNNTTALTIDTSQAVIFAGTLKSTSSANLNMQSVGNGTTIQMQNVTYNQTSGTQVAVTINPVYNQASGTAANTDLLINRTQTAVGSGAQYLIDGQIAGVSVFNVSNVAALTLSGPSSTSSVILGTSSGQAGFVQGNGANLIIQATQGTMTFKTNGTTTALTLDTSQNAQFAKKITSYNGISTVTNGVPSLLATIDSTGLTANVGASTLYAVPAAGEGMYRVSAYLVTTTAASVSSTMPNAQVVFTDKDSNTSVTLDVSPILGAAGLGQSGTLAANTVGTVFSGTVVIYVKASTTIQYQTVNYASTAGGMTYALRMKLEAL